MTHPVHNLCLQRRVRGQEFPVFFGEVIDDARALEKLDGFPALFGLIVHSRRNLRVRVNINEAGVELGAVQGDYVRIVLDQAEVRQFFENDAGLLAVWRR